MNSEDKVYSIGWVCVCIACCFVAYQTKSCNVAVEHRKEANFSECVRSGGMYMHGECIHQCQGDRQ